MSLSADKIEAIRQRASIVDVVGSAISLRKQGQRFIGLCPFHGEKTPSFSVTEEKGLYYCFGCHAGGDVFSFVMRHEGLDFNAAARKLAARVGVELEPESPEVRQRRQVAHELDRANTYALAFFERSLWADGGHHARAYLSERGTSEATCREWRLGYGSRTAELLAYLESKNVPTDVCARAGFLTEDGRKSLFDDRLIFPIYDSEARLAGFGGRRMRDPSGEVHEGGPKYINSRESPLFGKRRLLFGWQRAEGDIRRERRVVLVEGYFDVLACHDAGITNAVASLGTAFTEAHARTCARHVKEAVVLFDGDAAGIRASREAAEVVLGAGLKALVASLPPGEDPDSLVLRQGKDALKASLSRAMPAVEHFIEVALPAGMSIEDRAAAAQELAPLILGLSSGLERDLYTARLAEKVGVTGEQMAAHLRNSRPRPKPVPKPEPAGASVPSGERPPSAPTAPEPEAPPPRPTSFELQTLKELLLFPRLRSRWVTLAEYASDPMRLLLDDLSTSDEPVPDVLARHLPPQIARRLAAVEPAPSEDPGIDDGSDDGGERTLDDVLRRLKARHIEEAFRDTMRELQQAQARGDDTEDLVRRIQSLTRRKRELKRPQTAGPADTADQGPLDRVNTNSE